MGKEHMTTTVTRNVILTIHTTSGLEFEVTDADTGKSITGRDLWCADDADDFDDPEEFEDIEQAGWQFWRERIKGAGWNLVSEVWS